MRSILLIVHHASYCRIKPPVPRPPPVPPVPQLKPVTLGGDEKEEEEESALVIDTGMASVKVSRASLSHCVFVWRHP